MKITATITIAPGTKYAGGLAQKLLEQIAVAVGSGQTTGEIQHSLAAANYTVEAEPAQKAK